MNVNKFERIKSDGEMNWRQSQDGLPAQAIVQSIFFRKLR